MLGGGGSWTGASSGGSGSSGPSYTVGTGGVTKGDLLYVSGNDEVKKFPITGSDSFKQVIGLAETTVSAAGTVVAARNGTILTGVLSGATAGTVYWWDGSTLTATMPTPTTGAVWRAGTAKNATDLHVQVEFFKRTA